MPGFTAVEGLETDAPKTLAHASRWAWGLCWLMFASTVLNYMDRQSLALVGPQLRREFGIDFETFGWVLSAFSLTYALFQVPAGFLADALPTWKVYAGAVALWSFAAMAAAFSPVLGALIALRALLGVGESFNWPCALRITGEILPPKDRSLGNGIFNSGAAVGAVLTPLCLPLLVQWFGWRAAFVVVGALGFVWVAVWMAVTRGWKTAPKEPVAEAESTSGRMTRRARIGFGLVGLAGVAVVVLGAYWPAPVPVTLARLTPSEPLTVVRWLVKPGDKLDRRKTPVAEVSAGDARAQWLAPEEGTVDHLDAKPGDPIGDKSRALWINNSAETFPEPLDAVKPMEPATLVLWRVQPGDPVQKGAVLADVELGGRPFSLISEHAGTVARFEVEGGQTLRSDQTALVQYVTGFEPRANGL
ncbi:MAG TPA: MFS transporter, partial [Isosphaeraceae bacterium]|nr:MFS transporter [Isosphaeraceae bacterium]